MKILLLGYGNMGKTVEKHALERGHEIVGKISSSAADQLEDFNEQNTEVVIEFTSPDSAFDNINYCLENKLPVVSGSTGWLERKSEIEAICNRYGGAFFYAANFSVGANLFFYLNKKLAEVMKHRPAYDVMIEEIHHTKKRDVPSGTAVKLAEDIIIRSDQKKRWVSGADARESELNIVSLRENEVPGTHTVRYFSEIDDIEIKHTAHNRDGFALGAVLAAEWLQGKKGNFGMQEMLTL